MRSRVNATIPVIYIYIFTTSMIVDLENILILLNLKTVILFIQAHAD